MRGAGLPARLTGSPIIFAARLIGSPVTWFATGAGPYFGWRVPFVIVAIPTIALAALMLLTAEEPPRGVTEAALQARPPPLLTNPRAQGFSPGGRAAGVRPQCDAKCRSTGIFDRPPGQFHR